MFSTVEDVIGRDIESMRSVWLVIVGSVGTWQYGLTQCCISRCMSIRERVTKKFQPESFRGSWFFFALQAQQSHTFKIRHTHTHPKSHHNSLHFTVTTVRILQHPIHRNPAPHPNKDARKGSARTLRLQLGCNSPVKLGCNWRFFRLQLGCNSPTSQPRLVYQVSCVCHQFRANYTSKSEISTGIRNCGFLINPPLIIWWFHYNFFDFRTLLAVFVKFKCDPPILMPGTTGELLGRDFGLRSKCK